MGVLVVMMFMIVMVVMLVTMLMQMVMGTLMLVLPYHPAERAVPTPDGFDGTHHPEGLENTPRRYAIVRANQIMVDTCDWLVRYVRHGASNSRNLLEYARRREGKGMIQIINIAEGGANK